MRLKYHLANYMNSALNEKLKIAKEIPPFYETDVKKGTKKV
jgi:hypothetical protein